MLNLFYYIEVRTLDEGAVYRPYKKRGNTLSVYTDYASAFCAMDRISEKWDCVRVVRNDGVIIAETKKYPLYSFDEKLYGAIAKEGGK